MFFALVEQYHANNLRALLTYSAIFLRIYDSGYTQKKVHVFGLFQVQVYVNPRASSRMACLE